MADCDDDDDDDDVLALALGSEDCVEGCVLVAGLVSSDAPLVPSRLLILPFVGLPLLFPLLLFIVD